MAEVKKTRGKSATRAKAQKANTEVEVMENDNSIDTPQKMSVKRNVVGTGVVDGSESTPTSNDVIEELRREIEELKRQNNELKESRNTPSVIQVATTQEKVCFLWQAEVADDNTVSFGDNGRFGRIVGKTGTIYVPKNELSMLLDTKVRFFLQKRWLIYISGLDEQEIDTLGIKYEEGEILDKGAFARLVEMGDAILDIFPKLCDSHKEIVAKRYYEAWENGSADIKRETVLKLNDIVKKEKLEIGAFARIVEEMNEKELAD